MIIALKEIVSNVFFMPQLLCEKCCCAPVCNQAYENEMENFTCDYYIRTEKEEQISHNEKLLYNGGITN